VFFNAVSQVNDIVLMLLNLSLDLLLCSSPCDFLISFPLTSSPEDSRNVVTESHSLTGVPDLGLSLFEPGNKFQENGKATLIASIRVLIKAHVMHPVESASPVILQVREFRRKFDPRITKETYSLAGDIAPRSLKKSLYLTSSTTSRPATTFLGPESHSFDLSEIYEAEDEVYFFRQLFPSSPLNYQYHA
jgi:hypothetical protein